MIKYQQHAVDVAQFLDLDPSQLRKWIRQYEAEIQGIPPVGAALTPEQRRIQELEKQVRRLEMDKEILKQAAGLLSMNP